MSEEKIKESLYCTIKKQRGLIFAVIEQDSEPVTQNANTDAPSWCRCWDYMEIVELVEQDCCKRNPEDCIFTLLASADYFLYYL